MTFGSQGPNSLVRGQDYDNSVTFCFSIMCEFPGMATCESYCMKVKYQEYGRKWVFSACQIVSDCAIRG